MGSKTTWRAGPRRGLARRGLAVLAGALIVALVAAPASGLQAESGSEGAAAAAASAPEKRPERPVFHVPRTDRKIEIDADLSDPAWSEALEVKLDYETRPGENVDPAVETFCYVTYDSDHLYVGFRALDPDPKSIRAHLSDRDTIWNDDMVGVKLDAFNDERRAMDFFVNPLGVQLDIFEDDVSKREDSSWDVIWKSAGRITEEGYVVELAIPFHQMRFPRAAGMQTWGFDAIRFYPRSEFTRIALVPVDRNVECLICQMAKLNGFEDISPGRNLEVVPTLTAGRTDRRQDFPVGDLTEGDAESDLGLSVRWGVTPNWTLNAAANPDFSQVEADSAQLDVNTRFALFFPERRPFFLEGADFFRTPFDAVFTRNVADPSWGLKMSGKEGPHAVGIFVAEDELTNLIFPGSEGSSSGSFAFESTDAVVRYRRDFGQGSAIGVLATGREGDGYSNRVAGIDGLYRINDKDSVSFQYLGSESEYPLEIVRDFDQPAGSFSDEAFRVRYDHRARNWRWYGHYSDIGENFRADMDFMPQVGTTFVLGGLSRTWHGEEEDWWTRFAVGGDWDREEDSTGRVLEQEAEIWGEISGPMQSFLWVDVGVRDRSFRGVPFDDQRFFSSWFEIRPTGDLWFGLFSHKSDAIDFANVQAGEVIQLEPNVNVNFGLHLKAELGHVFQRFKVPQGELFEANLTQLRLVWQFNTRSFVRSIFQYRQVDRDPALFARAVEPRFERLFTQLLFSYKLNPQTVLFLGYSDNRLGDQTIDLTQRDRTLFFKVGYAWLT